jgi:acetyl-CoA synthetase
MTNAIITNECEEDYLVIAKPWPGMLRTIYKDPDRYVKQY